jgi:GntR family transcriptional regulator
LANSRNIPLYARIESLLRSKILSGQYEPGQRLPTAGELATEFGASKITINGALANLQRDGLIVGKQGKGTFVADSIPVTKQFLITGAIHDVLLDAARYEVETSDPMMMTVGETRVPKALQTFFNITNSQEIGFIKRIRRLGGVPIYFVENFLSPDMIKHLTSAELSKKPLLKIMKEKAGITIGRGEMYLEAVPAESDIARLLDCQPYDPLIHIQVYYWLASGEPFETANSYMRAEYFKYKAEIDPTGFEKE